MKHLEASLKWVFSMSVIYVVIGVVAFSVLVAATPKPKPSLADQRIMAKRYSVLCLECEMTYKLRPVAVPTWTGNGHAVSNGVMREIILKFRCPSKHQFSAKGPDQFVPTVVAVEAR